MSATKQMAEIVKTLQDGVCTGKYSNATAIRDGVLAGYALACEIQGVIIKQRDAEILQLHTEIVELKAQLGLAALGVAKMSEEKTVLPWMKDAAKEIDASYRKHFLGIEPVESGIINIHAEISSEAIAKHAWMVQESKPLPKRCGNIKKRCWHWNRK